MPHPARYLAAAIAALAYVVASQWLMTSAPASAWNAVAVLAPMLAVVAVGTWRAGQRVWSGCAAASIVALALGAARGGSVSAPLLYLGQHVGAHLFLAAVFGGTLRAGRLALITRAAARVHRHFTPALAHYTRGVTLAWTLYFIAMALLSLALFALAPFEAWAWFANVATPLALAAMFVGEHVLRYRLHPEFERIGVRDAIRAYRLHASGATPATRAGTEPTA